MFLQTQKKEKENLQLCFGLWMNTKNCSLDPWHVFQFRMDRRHTLESWINIVVRLLIFDGFSSGYILIKGGYIYWFLIFLKLFKNFYLSFPLAIFKRVKLSAIWEGATFIQGAMFIDFAKCSRGYVYSRGYVFSGV